MNPYVVIVRADKREALLLAKRLIETELAIAKASRARDGVLAGLRHDRAGFRPRMPRAEWEATHGGLP